MRWNLPTILASFAFAGAACSPLSARPAPVPQAVPAGRPNTGLRVIPLTISQNGNRHTFQVEVAKTSAQQETGLMFRTKMAKDHGMLFPSPYPEARTFWMKNTIIPLDIVFIGPDHRISNIAAKAVPYSLDPIPSAGETIAVLELNGGRAAELGFTPGALVSW
jgi:uncharacterized membrane protein (UPF0127 family)